MTGSPSQICPICFKSNEKKEKNSVEGEGIGRKKKGRLLLQRRFFHLLHRYLHNGTGGGGGEEDLKNFSFIACGGCFELMDSFCQLFHQLDTIHLQLNWKLERLVGEMKGGKGQQKGTYPHIRRILKEGGGHQNDVDVDDLLDSVIKWRKSLTVRCSNKIRSSFPKVSVKKWVREEENLMVKHPRIVAPYSHPPLPSIPSPKETPKSSSDCLSAFRGGTQTQPGPSKVSSDSDGFLSAGASRSQTHVKNGRKCDGVSLSPKKETIKMETSQVNNDGSSSNRDLEVQDLFPPSDHFNTEPVEGCHGTTEKGSEPAPCQEDSTLQDLKSQDEPFSDLEDVEDNVNSVHRSSSSSSSTSSDSVTSSETEDFNRKSTAKRRRRRKKLGNGMKPKLSKVKVGVPTSGTTLLKCPDCRDWFDGVRKFLEHRKDSKSCGGATPPESEPSTSRQSIRVEVLLKRATATNQSSSEEKVVVEIPEELYICKICDIPLYSKEDFDDHAKLHGKFKCNFCKFSETYAPNLTKHERLRHQGNNNEKRKRVRCKNGTFHYESTFCPRCDLEFSVNAPGPDYLLQHHLGDHLNLKLNLPQCPICKTTKPGKFDIGEHFKSHHDLSNVMVPEDMKICEVDNCGAYFVSRGSGGYNGLKDHFFYRHGIGEMFRMKRKVPQKSNSTETETSTVPEKKGRKEFGCRDCDKVFCEPKYLRIHRLRYHVPPEKVIHCTVPKCKGRFESNIELQRHMFRSKKFHESLENPEKKGVLVPCPVCGKMIRGDNQGYYKSHMKTHEEGHQKMSYVCDICGKSCRDKGRLEVHLYHHSGSKKEGHKFECNECGKKFFLKVKLEEHVRAQHLKERPFICEICGEAYAHKHILKRHFKMKHGESLGMKGAK